MTADLYRWMLTEHRQQEWWFLWLNEWYMIGLLVSGKIQ